MTEKTPVYSLSICARITLNMHSLNNEGGEGNQMQTRMVDIVGTDGKIYNVNAISGDMFKHIQAEHLYHIAREREQLPLCQACKMFDANRISADPDFLDQITGKSDVDALDLMLKSCTIDDLEGILITANRSTPRKSVVEFGWVVGIPVDEEDHTLTTSNSYFHVKFASERGDEARKAAKKDEARKSNLGQIPFNRPASSGVYAFVNHYEISRIGYNDVSQKYAIDENQRQLRYQALLESILFTVLQMNGAMRSTQMPHLVAIEGVLTYTKAVLPAPTVSPLAQNYCQEVTQVSDILNQLYPQQVETLFFDSLSQFASSIQSLIQSTSPFTVRV